MLLGLIHNIAMLLAISMLTDFFWKKEESKRTLIDKILIGLILGFMIVAIMLTPWILIPGVVFDTRSVLLGISGLFFGWIPTLIVTIFAIVFRLITGGDGLLMGIGVIVSSGAIGLIWQKFRSKWFDKRDLLELYILGLLVHIAMLACIILLPSDRQLSVFKTIALPVLLAYPVFLLLFGVVLKNRRKLWETKRALRASEEKFRVFFENNSAPTAILESDTTMSTVNEAFCRMIGFTKEEIKGTSWMQQIVPEDLERLVMYNQLRQAGSEEAPLIYEFSYYTKARERRQTQISISYLKDYSKKIASFIDLTEIKQTEQQLIRAKESAEQNDRLKSAFLATMSHELRTPLNAIIGFSDMLVVDNERSDSRNFGRIINENGNQLLAIIESIFELALLQSKESEVKISCFACDELFHHLGQSLNVEKKSKKKENIETEYLPDKLFPRVLINTDKLKLIQLIGNLLNNAIKYTERGKIEYGYLVNGKDIVFYVRDTGIGIPESKLHVIFEKFRQADESHSRLHGGVGLGLAICNEIAVLLNGKLWVESNVGIGSTFYFELNNLLAEEPETTKSIIQNMIVPNFTGKIFLIVDDLDDNIFLLTKILEVTGARLLTSTSGPAAIQTVIDVPEVDLVLMDIKMPGMDGFIATKEIHKIKPDMPVIAQTAFAMKDDEQNALDFGCIGYISKPIIREELYLVIEKIFKEK